MAKKGHFLLGFVFGAASALATTYLLTPQTSDELKRRVKHASEDLADRAVDYFDYAKEASADWKQSATDFVDELKRKGDDADGSKALANYDAATEQLRDQLNTATDTDSSADFDDIVLDGKSAFAQAKDDDEGSGTRTDEVPEPVEPEAVAPASTDTAPASSVAPDEPQASATNDK